MMYTEAQMSPTINECDCCGKSLTKVVWVQPVVNGLLICSRCHAWAYKTIKFTKSSRDNFICSEEE